MFREPRKPTVAGQSHKAIGMGVAIEGRQPKNCGDCHTKGVPG